MFSRNKSISQFFPTAQSLILFSASIIDRPTLLLYKDSISLGFRSGESRLKIGDDRQNAMIIMTSGYFSYRHPAFRHGQFSLSAALLGLEINPDRLIKGEFADK